MGSCSGHSYCMQPCNGADRQGEMVQSLWAALPQRVGVVSQRCAAVKRLPLNNKVAIGRKLTQVCAGAYIHVACMQPCTVAEGDARCAHACHAKAHHVLLKRHKDGKSWYLLRATCWWHRTSSR